MKVLIGYDGSVCSDNAIMDLRRAGLPAQTEALVMCIGETSHQLTTPFSAMGAIAGVYVPECVECEDSYQEILQEARGLADQGAQRLRADFPQWRVSTEAWIDSPAQAIIRKAHAWNPDLIVIGSHGRGGFARLVLGSVSMSVLRNAHCSVRISRHHLHPQQREIRLMIGVDASACSKKAVAALAARNWPKGTEARIIAVMDCRIKTAAAMTLEGTIPVATEELWRSELSDAAHDASEALRGTGLHVSHQIVAGRPDEELLLEAEKWEADCIFVGARGRGRIQRALLGGTSTTVASRAQCSVEVVRGNTCAN